MSRSRRAACSTRARGSPIPGGSYQTYDLPALAQTNGCADLSTAAAYSLNVTLVPQNHPVSYLTIWPAGLAQPVTSTMNSLDGRVKANAAIVPAGVSAGVNVYVTNTTNLLLDIDGYFTAPSSSTLKFYPLTPCRVADTRSSNYPPGLGTPNLSGGAAQISGAEQHLYSERRHAGRLLAELHRDSLSSTGIALGYLESLADGTAAAEPGVDAEQSHGNECGQCGDRSGRHRRQHYSVSQRGTNLAIDINGYFASSGPADCRCILRRRAACSIRVASAVDSRSAELESSDRRGRQPVQRAQCGSGLRLQRDRDPFADVAVSDVVARR